MDTDLVIVRNESTLVVLGRDGGTAAVVSAATGLAPTSAAETGDHPLRGSVRPYSQWHLTVAAGAEDESGFHSMRVLLATILPSMEALRELQSGYEVRLDWAGFSDSSQGGFVLEPDVARGLGELGLPVYATAYIDD